MWAVYKPIINKMASKSWSEPSWCNTDFWSVRSVILLSYIQAKNLIRVSRNGIIDDVDGRSTDARVG